MYPTQIPVRINKDLREMYPRQSGQI